MTYSISSRLPITVRLDGDDRYRLDTPTGPIMAECISVWNAGSIPAGSVITVAGRAIKADGGLALFNRQTSVAFNDLPAFVRDGIRAHAAARNVVVP